MTSYERVMLRKKKLERQQGFLKNRIRTAEHHVDVLAVVAYRAMKATNAVELQNIYSALSFCRNRKSKLSCAISVLAALTFELTNGECPPSDLLPTFNNWYGWICSVDAARPHFTDWQRNFTKYEGKKKADLKALVATL